MYVASWFDSPTASGAVKLISEPGPNDTVITRVFSGHRRVCWWHPGLEMAGMAQSRHKPRVKRDEGSRILANYNHIYGN